MINEKTPVLNEYGVEQGGYVPAPSGMNGVVPAWHIKELLNMPELKKLFDEAEQKHIKAVSASRVSIQPAVASLKAAPPASDANPNHREDFMRLVGEAARKPAQED